jgi:hypothetical protein
MNYVDLVSDTFAARNIQKDLIELIITSDKKEADRICKNITITGTSFASLINHPDVVNCTHRFKSSTHVPLQRKLPPNIIDELGGENHTSAFNKINSVFEERKIICAHLFEGQNWAIFYFYQRDINNSHSPPWKGGPHMHFVSRVLAPNHSCGMIWQEFENRNYNIPGHKHIRYIHNENM